MMQANFGFGVNAIICASKGGVTLVNLQRQLATIRCCEKNRSSLTPRCGRFFCDICSAAMRCKFLKVIQMCNMSANSCEKYGLRIGVASWRCKFLSVTPP